MRGRSPDQLFRRSAGDDGQDDPKHEHHGASVVITEFCQGWPVDERHSLHQWRIWRRH